MISLKSTRVGTLIYNECMELQQLIFSPSIPGVLEQIKLDDYNEDGIKGLITSAVNFSAKFEVREPIPLVIPSYIGKRALYIKAFYVGDALWQEYVDAAHTIENDKQLEKDERKRVSELNKIERQYAKEEADKLKKKRAVLRGNKEKGKSKRLDKVKNRNHYTATFVYKDTGEIYKIYEAKNQRMLSYRTGIPKTRLSGFYNKPVLLKTNKIKHIQGAIESHGLLLIIDTNIGSHD